MFLVPQMSAPFKIAGVHSYEEQRSTAYERFHRETGFTLCSRVGIDTSAYEDGWRGVSPRAEVVFADFEDAEEGLLPVPAPRFVSTPEPPCPRPSRRRPRTGTRKRPCSETPPRPRRAGRGGAPSRR
ncbi:hypothetical protein SHKM778_94460 (plasmid) [Streptomyces sp. KM77-8]|uniref:EthD domain-containing protein n=1 Tax=Streptomyces haneummycinicus TaxID=3074435 RepID=A0AAT9HZC5_9ACTN